MEMLKPVVVITSADIRLAERYLRRQLTSPCGSLSTNVSKDVLEEGSASVPLSTIHLRTLQSKAVHRHPVKALREKPLVLISATDVSTTKRILPRRKRSERNDSSSVRRRRQLLRKALPTPSPNVLKAPSIVIDISQPASIIAGRCCDQVSTFANNVKVPQGEQQLEETASAAIDTACQQDAVSDKLPDPLESRDMCAGKRVCVTSLKHHSKPEENVSPEMDEGRVVSTVNNICSSGFELRLKALTDDINLLERYHLTEPERDLTHLKKSIANTLSDVAGLFKNHPSLVRDCHAMAYAVSPCKERLTRIEWYAKNEDPLRLPVESISQADSCVTRIKEKALSEAQQKSTCKDGHVDAATKASLVQGDTVKVLLHNKSAPFVANKIKVGITCLPGLCDKAVNRDAMIDGSSGVVSTVPKIGVPNSSVDALISVLNHLHRKILAWDSSMCEFSCNRACGLTVNSSVPSYDCVEDVQDNGKSQSLLDMFSLNQVPNVKVDKTTDKKLKSEPISVKKATVQIPSTDFDCAASTHDAHSTMTLNPSLRLPYNSSSSRTDLVDNLSQHSLVSEEHFSQPEEEQMLVNKITQDVVARSDTEIKSQPVNHSPNNNIQNKVGKNVKCCRPTSVENEPIKVNSRKLVAIHKDSQCYCVSQSSKSKNVTENSTDDSLKVKEASLEDSVSCIVCEQVFHEVQQSQSFSTRDSNAKNSNRQGSVTKEDNSQNEAKQTSPYNSKNKSFERVQSELTVEQTDPDTLVAKRVLNPVLNESLNGPTDSNMHLKTDLSKNSKNESRETNQSRHIRPLSTNYGLQVKTKCADDKKECLKNDQNRLSPFDTNTNSNIHVINPTIDESSNQFTAVPRISLRQNAKRDLPPNSKKESGESEQYQVTVSPLQDDISSPVVSCIATKKLPKRSIELRPLLKNSNLNLNSRQASSSNAKKTSKNQHRQSSPIVAETATNKPVTNRVLNNALDKSCNQHKTVTVVTDVLVNDEHSPSTGTKTQSSENEQIHSVVLATVGEASESIDSCIAGTDKNMSKNLNLHKRFLCEKNLSLTHDAKEMPFFSSEKGASQEKTTITQPNACYAKSGVDPTSSNLSLLRQEIEEAEMPHDAKQVTSSFKVGCSENKQTQLSIDQAHIISATSAGESYSIVDEKLEPNKSLRVDCDLQLSPKVTYYEKKTDESNKNHVTIPQTDTIGDHGSNNSFSENLTQPIHNKPVYRKSNLHSKAEQSFSSSSKKGLSENVVQNDVNTSVSFVRHITSINSDASVAMEQKLHVKEVKTVQEKNDSNANEDCHSTRVMTSRIRRKKNFYATPKIKQTPVTHSETDSLKHLEKRSTPVQTNTESTKAVNSVILNVNQSEPEPVVSTLQVGVKLTSSTSSEMGSVEQECTLIEADNDISTSIVNPISKNNLSKHLLSEMNSGSKANGKLGPLKNCEKAFQKCLQSPIKLSKSYTGMDSCLMRHSQPDISSTPSGVDPMLEKQGNDDLNFFKPKIAETDNGILTLDAQQLACNICTSSYASETNELELVGTDISSRNSKVSYQYQKKLDDGLNKFKSVSIDNSNLKLGASCTATKHRKAETCRGVIAPVVTLDSSISLDNNSNLSQLPVDNNSKSKPDKNQVVSTDLNPHHSSIDNQPASVQSCDGSIKYAVSSVCLNNEEKQQCRHVVRKVSNMKRTKKRLTSTSCTKDCGLKTATQLTAPNKASEPSAHVVCPNVVSGVYSSKFERITPPVSECRKPHFRHKNHSSKASDSGTNVIPKLDTDLKTVMSVPVNTASLIGDVKSRTPVVILSRLSIVDINKMCTANQEKDMPNVPNATAAQCVKPLRIDEGQSVTSTAQLCEGVTTAVCVKTLRVKKKLLVCVLQINLLMLLGMSYTMLKTR